MLLCTSIAPCQAENQTPLTQEESFEKAHADFFALLFDDPTDASIRYTVKPWADVKGDHGKTELDQTEVNISTGVPFSRDTVGFIDLTYQSNYFKFGHTRKDRGLRQKISSSAESFEFGLGVGTFVDDDDLIAGIFYPSLRSDLENTLSSDDFQYMTGPLAVHQFSDRLSIHGGFLTIVRSYDTSYFPVLGISYFSRNKDLRVNVTAPFRARIGKKLDETTELYSSVVYSDEEFRAEIGSIEPFDAQIKIKDVQVGTGAMFRVAPQTYLSVEAGVAFNTGYHIEPKDAPAFSGNFKTTPYLAVLLGYSFQ